MGFNFSPIMLEAAYASRATLNYGLGIRNKGLTRHDSGITGR